MKIGDRQLEIKEKDRGGKRERDKRESQKQKNEYKNKKVHKKCLIETKLVFKLFQSLIKSSSRKN